MREAAEILAGKAALAQINTDDNPHLAARFGVRGIPVILLLREGAEVDRLVGAQSAQALVAWFQQHEGR